MIKLFTLKEMCRELNLSRRTIQCYEQAGLMKPVDTNKYGHLIYDENTIERARRIRFLHEIEYRLADIKDLIDAPNSVIRRAVEDKIEELQLRRTYVSNLITEAKLLIEKLSENEYQAEKRNENEEN